MTINLTQLPTAEQVTNLFLYGQLTAPTDKAKDTWIRESGIPLPDVNIDINTYMAGPGHFATPDKFELVKWFLNPLTNASSFQLAPGTYTKEQLFGAFGISKAWIGIDQAQYDDGKDDFLARAYIWNTTAFKIKDGATFVVEANGNRRIDEFAVVPFLNYGD